MSTQRGRVSCRRFPTCPTTTRPVNMCCVTCGGIYDVGVVITDPVIMSRTRQYGVTDLGPKGISNFFANHDFNEYCRRSWTKPANPRRNMNPVQGTNAATSKLMSLLHCRILDKPLCVNKRPFFRNHVRASDTLIC